MNVVNLDIDRVLQNNDMSCRIHLPEGSRDQAVIRGHLSGNFGFSLGNKWGQIADINSIPILGDFLTSNNLNLLVSLANDDIGGSMPQISPQPIPMTAASWQGSDLPKFSVNLAFISTDYTINPLESLLLLAQGALPSNEYDLTKSSNKYVRGFAETLNKASNWGIDFVGNIANKFVDITNNSDVKDSFNSRREDITGLNNQMYKLGTMAPFGFGLNTLNDGEVMSAIPNTTITLAIGNWFFAPNLIMDGISGINISKEVIRPLNGKGGWPLYVTCNVDLRPYKMITYPEFLTYFKMNMRTGA